MSSGSDETDVCFARQLTRIYYVRHAESFGTAQEEDDWSETGTDLHFLNIVSTIEMSLLWERGGAFLCQ